MISSMSDNEPREEQGAENTSHAREPVRITPDGASSRPELRARAPQRDESAAEEPPTAAEQHGGAKKRPTRKVALPSQADRDERLAYATHRPAPGDEQKQPPAPPEEPKTPVGPPSEGEETEVSAAFVLGVVIIVIAIVLGVMLARLSGRVSRLERAVFPQEMNEAGE
jgi:hypothetical protein